MAFSLPPLPPSKLPYPVDALRLRLDTRRRPLFASTFLRPLWISPRLNRWLKFHLASVLRFLPFSHFPHFSLFFYVLLFSPFFLSFVVFVPSAVPVFLCGQMIGKLCRHTGSASHWRKGHREPYSIRAIGLASTTNVRFSHKELSAFVIKIQRPFFNFVNISLFKHSLFRDNFTFYVSAGDVPVLSSPRFIRITLQNTYEYISIRIRHIIFLFSLISNFQRIWIAPFRQIYN